jgi:hypothetical protein
MIEIRVEGLEKTIRKLNAEIRKIKFLNRKGLIKAGLFIQREAQKRCPVLTGNMKASAFTVWGPETQVKIPVFKSTTPSGGKVNVARMVSNHMKALNEIGGAVTRSEDHPQVAIGFSAAYSLYVHENIEAQHVTGQSKFLQAAINENINRIAKIAAEEIK